VFAYVLAIRLQAHRPLSKLSITQIMRKLRRDHNLKDLLTTHFGIVSKPIQKLVGKLTLFQGISQVFSHHKTT